MKTNGVVVNERMPLVTAATCTGCWPDFGGRADPGDAKAIEIGPVDRHRLGARQRLDPAFHQVPRLQPAGPQIRTDDEHRRHRPARHSPVGKTDHDRNGVGHAVDGKRAIALARVQQRRVLEGLGSARHDPEIGGRMVDHRRHHAPEAEIEAHLDGDQNDGKHDPDHGRNEDAAGRETGFEKRW